MADPYEHLRGYYKDFEDQPYDYRKVAWRGPDDQHLRFQLLLEAIDDARYPISILDVGCGLGALYGYLKANDKVTNYVGIDLLPKMIEGAKSAHPDGTFILGDLLTDAPHGPFDLVVCSGSLNVRVDNHELWVQQMLKAMFERATLAVATNFQITRAFRFNPLAKTDTDLVHVEPKDLLTWCDSITPWFSYRADYLGDDATVYLYKRYHRSAERLHNNERVDDRTSTDQACGMAFLLLERRCPERALEILEELEPTADVLNYKGLCYHRMGDHAQARKYYKAALELNPWHHQAQLNLDWVSKE